MPCDVPARVFAGVPELQVIQLDARYILMISPDPQYQPGNSASGRVFPGWGWADEGDDGLGEEIYQAGQQQRFNDITIFRRVDGVMVAGSNAAVRRRLMSHVDKAAEVSTEYYLNQDEVFKGETWHCSRLRPAAPVRLVPSIREPPPTPARSSIYGPAPRTGRSIDRQERLARAERALQVMTEAVASLDREVAHLQYFLSELQQSD